VSVQIAEIEKLIGRLDALEDAEARTTALALVQSLMDMHAEAFGRVFDLCGSEELMARLAGDELVGSLLLLYGLHPDAVETRVEAALERVRPYLRSHGGSVVLLRVEEGVVHLRLDGSCHDCPSSSRTIKLAVEDAIFEAAPEVEKVVADGSASAVAGGRWENVGDLTSLANASGRMVDVGGQRLYVCRADENLYAWGSACPGCGAELDGAAIDGRSLGCRACGRRFDLYAAGQSLEEPSLHLDPFPLLIEHGQARVALAVREDA
jgi:Fe-S cluster biogenesis protein NfuA/nitrite reductase/ring-hydroxylating ferredoxin subunit